MIKLQPKGINPTKILTESSFVKKGNTYFLANHPKGEVSVSEEVLEKILSDNRSNVELPQSTVLNIGDLTKFLLLNITGHGTVKINKQLEGHIRISGHTKLNIAEQWNGINSEMEKSSAHIGTQYGGSNFVDAARGAHLDVETFVDGSNSFTKKPRPTSEILTEIEGEQEKMTVGQKLFQAFFPIGFQDDAIKLKDAIKHAFAKKKD